MTGQNGGHKGLAEPPEGAITGDTVPRENELDEQQRRLIDEMVGQMKGHPAYSGRSDDELRELAKERVL